MSTGSVRPQHFPARTSGLVDDAAMRPLHPARLMIDRMTIAAVARELGLSWDTVNTIAMDATQMIVAADTTRLERAGHRC